MTLVGPLVWYLQSQSLIREKPYLLKNWNHISFSSSAFVWFFICFFLREFSFTESLCEPIVYISINWILLCSTKLISVLSYTSFSRVFIKSSFFFMIRTSSWEGDEKFSSSGSWIWCGIADPEVVTASLFLDGSDQEFCNLPNSLQESIELLDILVGLL